MTRAKQGRGGAGRHLAPAGGKDGYRCTVSPAGIPASMLEAKHDRRQPYPGDRGIWHEPARGRHTMVLGETREETVRLTAEAFGISIAEAGFIVAMELG